MAEKKNIILTFGNKEFNNSLIEIQEFLNFSLKILDNFKENIEKLNLPASFHQINKIVINNVIRRKFKINSSLNIDNYKLDKNLRRLVKDSIYLELTEKEIELIELLKKKPFIKKKEILSTIWKYSDNADTHTVETHIYRLRKKIKDNFNDNGLIKSSKKGYTI